MASDLERPEVTPLPDGETGYVFVWPVTAVKVDLARFSDKRGELRAEATIARTIAGQEPSLLFEGEINLLSVTTRNQTIKYLESRERGADVPWATLLEHLCFLAKRRYRAGTPAIHAREIETDTRPRFALRPYVEYGRPTVLFGPGASTKTYGGVAAACSWATGLPIFGEPMGEALPVMFVDTETDRRGWKRRLLAVMRGHGIDREPDVYYRRVFGVFADSAGAILAECKRLGVGYLVLDSLGGAVGGELVDPVRIITCFDALARFELPTLIVSHVSADTMRMEGNGHLLPFGTIYTENCAGNTFSLHNRSEQGAPQASVFLRHQKVNDGTKVPDHGYTVAFTNDANDADLTWSVEYQRQDADAPEMAVFEDKLPVSDRILRYLTANGAEHLKVVAQALDLPEAQVNARGRDLLRRGMVVQLQDRRYGVVARQEQRDA